MSVPHRDDTPFAISRRPHDYDETSAQPPDSDKTRLAVIVAIIDAREVAIVEDLFRIGKIETALGQGRASLALVPRVRHLCIHRNQLLKAFVETKSQT
jgi:hypothetical protein